MSKYEDRGAYHYAEFADKKSIYRAHVLDLLAVVQKHTKPRGDLLDVGAGEGLISRKLSEAGFVVRGCDVDKRAVELAAEKGNDVILGTIENFVGGHFDAVLICDVLEHVEDPVDVVEQAKRLAPIIVIAVPDRHDPHACNEILANDVLDFFDDADWKDVHHETRHARHFFVFKREGEATGTPANEGGETATAP